MTKKTKKNRRLNRMLWWALYGGYVQLVVGFMLLGLAAGLVYLLFPDTRTGCWGDQSCMTKKR